jgi:hypothetical protein
MERRRWLGRGALAVAVMVALAAWLLPARRIAREHHLPEPARLSTVARAELHTRMMRHGLTMENLTWQVTLLDYDGAKGSAAAIAAEPRLARPLAGDASELNASLPDRFFLLQDELRKQVGEVGAAAARRDGEGLAQAYGALNRTCVACHQAYFEGQ